MKNISGTVTYVDLGVSVQATPSFLSLLSAISLLEKNEKAKTHLGTDVSPLHSLPIEWTDY
jgi:hypothetical protein